MEGLCVSPSLCKCLPSKQIFVKTQTLHPAGSSRNPGVSSPVPFHAFFSYAFPSPSPHLSPPAVHSCQIYSAFPIFLLSITNTACSALLQPPDWRHSNRPTDRDTATPQAATLSTRLPKCHSRPGHLPCSVDHVFPKEDVCLMTAAMATSQGLCRHLVGEPANGRPLSQPRYSSNQRKMVEST